PPNPNPPNPNPNANQPPNTAYYYAPVPNPNANPPPANQWNGGFTSEWQNPPPRQFSSMSLLLGGDFGVLVPARDITQSVSVSDNIGIGGCGGGNVAFRFARFFLIGGIIGGGGFGGGNGCVSGNGCTRGVTAGGSTFYAGPYLAYMSNPEGFGFYGEI